MCHRGPVTFDPFQRFISLVPGANGVIYGIQSDGSLLWYRHVGWTTGSANWANNGIGKAIGSEWQQFGTVLADADGTLFGFGTDGTVRWYKYVVTDLTTGAGYWHPNSGTQIGSGFDVYARFAGGWGGVIYCFDDSGDLYYYHYAATDGSLAWSNGGEGIRIGQGWNVESWVWADPNGVFYAWENSSTLNWWRYVITDVDTGSGSWANGGQQIALGYGWGENSQKTVFSNTHGVIYAVALDQGDTPAYDDTLNWYRLLNSESVDSAGVGWVSTSGTDVGSGFTVQQCAALQGYPSALSAVPGAAVGIKVSTTWPTYTAEVFRYAPAADGPVGMVPAAAYAGKLQTLPTDFRSAGCGWADAFEVDVAATWPSGIYAARLTSPHGNLHDVTFVVRQSVPKAPIAVVLPTNTYHAYNSWGGHFQYSVGQDSGQRTISLRRPNLVMSTRPVGFVNKGVFADLFLTTWLTRNNISYDCYTDGDLDLDGAAWLPKYKAMVLCSHPEYWTQNARTVVSSYVNAGGRLVYLGGDGIYEEVSYTTDRSAVVFRNTDGDRNLFENLGEPQDQVLGVDYVVPTYMDFYPYQVVTQHPLLDGTGLNVGDTFGGEAYNGAASGWEVDASPGSVPGQVIIASGQNPSGGADLTMLTVPGGGWVFTASSISWIGALPVDPAVQRITANVFAQAVA